jgi:CHAT domain-containing protein/tetratricopeptide (TPR) repeat protein
LTACPGFAQSTQARAPSGGESWLARVQALEDPLDCAALERLLSQFEERSHGTRHDDRDFGDGYCEATVVRLGCTTDREHADVELSACVKNARDVAQAWGGSLDARLRVENEYAKALTRLGKLDEARQVLQEGLKTLSGARASSAESLQLLVNLSALQCRFEEGEAYAARGETLLRALIAEERSTSASAWLRFHGLLLSQLLGDLSQIHLKMGLPDRAGIDLEREAAACLELGHIEQPNFSLIRLAMDRAVFALAIQDFDGCIAQCDQVRTLGIELELSETRRFAGYRAVALSHLARMRRADPSEATKLFRDLLQSVELDALDREQALDGLVDLELRVNDLAAARKDLDELTKLLDADRVAAELVDEVRERALAHRAEISLREHAPVDDLRKRRDELERGCDDMFARQARLPTRSGGIGYLHWANPRELLSARIRVELALDASAAGVERAFDTIARAQSLGTLGRSVGAPPVTLKDARGQLLSRGVGMLVYLPALERSHLVVVDSGDAHHVPLAPRYALVEATRAFANRVYEPPDAGATKTEASARKQQIRATGDALRDLVLPAEALEHMRDWTGFYVVGEDLIGSPPLEAIPSPSGASLGEAFAISHLPSVPVGVWLARRASDERALMPVSSLVVLAAPLHCENVRTQWPELEPLTMTPDDVHALEESFAPSRASVLAGEKARRSALDAALATAPDMLEMITHGVYSPQRERPAGLVIGETDPAQAGIVWCDDIERSARSARVVALLACGSALGPTRMGDDSAAQLGNAFLRQGAWAVLLSRGKLAYRAMLALAESFNGAIRERGRSTAEALRIARSKLAQSVEWRDPFYYGQVSVVGIGLEPLSVESRKSRDVPRALSTSDAAGAWWIAIAIVGGALVLVAWVFYRRR